MDNSRRDLRAEYGQDPVVYDYTNYQIAPQAGNVAKSERFYQIEANSHSQNSYSREPERVLCPICKNVVTTRVVHSRGVTAWVLCVILCVFCFPFCIYPLICTPCLDTQHICPHCENELANIPMI